MRFRTLEHLCLYYDITAILSTVDLKTADVGECSFSGGPHGPKRKSKRSDWLCVPRCRGLVPALPPRTQQVFEIVLQCEVSLQLMLKVGVDEAVQKVAIVPTFKIKALFASDIVYCCCAAT